MQGRAVYKAAIAMVALLATGLVTTSVLAPRASAAPGDELSFELGAAGRMQPSYPGADSTLFYPAPIFKLRVLVLPIFGQVVGGGRASGISVYPAFNFVGARDSSDHAELTGLNDIGWALELGGGVRFTSDRFEAFAEVRHGIGGHHGFVGDIGLDGIAHPSEKLTLKLGPRLAFADADYMSTYFGVTAGEALSSSFPAYRAGGGIRDVGLQFQAAYAWTPSVTLYADAGYRRLLGEAADSPIVRQSGSADQFTAGIGATYRFSFDFDGR